MMPEILLILMGDDSSGPGSGVDNLLLEDGSNLLQEDGTSVVVLED